MKPTRAAGVVIEAPSDNANEQRRIEDDSEQVGGKSRPAAALQLRAEELLSSAPGENQAPIATLSRSFERVFEIAVENGAWTSPRWRERRAQGLEGQAAQTLRDVKER